MNILLAMCLILLAGMINGSFALPTKYVKKWNFENIWLLYAIWAFIILPWIMAALLVPQILKVYLAVPWYLILVMVIGGFLFGAGQIGFAFAIAFIGIGLTFVICLGLATGLGFFLPLLIQHPEQLLTPFGIISCVGTLLAIVGLLISAYAGELRDRSRKQLMSQQAAPIKLHYRLGVFLAIIAGLFSAGQNFSFSLTAHMQQIAQQMGATHTGASLVMWPGFLLFSFIPYAAYMIYLQRKNGSFTLYRQSSRVIYSLLALVMGICWFGSIACYSEASALIGKLGPVVGWPLFMVVIILTSNFVGWRHNEWSGVNRKIKGLVWIAILMMIISVIILGFSSYLR